MHLKLKSKLSKELKNDIEILVRQALTYESKQSK